MAPHSDDRCLKLAHTALTACVLEVTAPKPGNVHRGADFEDLTYLDFLLAGIAVVPAFARAAAGGAVGSCVLEAVEGMRSSVATNTSLGTILLMVPLLKAAAMEGPWSTTIAAVLDGLDAEDARHVYHGIRIAQPGGMERVEQGDVADAPPADLLWAMRQASQRDLVARQYANRFADVFEVVVPALGEAASAGWPWADGIVYAACRLMAHEPDSLIARKCGPAVAQRAQAGAQRVLEAGPPGTLAFREELAELDFWLRSDGHRRNPGTTADLLAAGLFVALVDGIIQGPIRFYP